MLGSRFLRPATCALALVLALAVAAPAAAKPLPASDRVAVDAIVEAAMADARLPGVSISISGPRGSYARSYGVADRNSGRPLRAADHVRIASITKTFTATAVLRLVQDGRLRLSDKLSRWFPGIAASHRITLRDLLAMRSGIYDFTSDARFRAEFAANPRMHMGVADVLAIIKRHPAAFAPGARTEYADSNYYLLGAILERASGESAAAAITKRVIRPLGLRRTSFPTSARMPAPFARGYYAGEAGDGPIADYTAVNPDVAWTAGAMVSTIGDLRVYGRQLATGRLLAPWLQRERLRFGRIPNGDGPFLGYGLGILRVGDWIGHDGAIFGFSTETMYNPRNGAQIVGVANLSSNSSTPTMSIFGAVAQHLYPRSLTG